MPYLSVVVIVVVVVVVKYDSVVMPVEITFSTDFLSVILQGQIGAPGFSGDHGEQGYTV